MRLFDTCIGRLFGRIRPGSSYRAFPWRSWDRICTILETCVGYGILINRTTTGSDWSLELDPTVAAKVKPFAVVVADGKIYCYLPPSETQEAVRVNGRKVSTTQTLGTTEQPWVELGSAEQNLGFIVLTFARGLTASDADGGNADGSTLTWSLQVGVPVFDIGGDNIFHNMPIASVSDDGVVQVFDGAIDITIWIPDTSVATGAEPPANYSLDLRSDGVAQLHRFDDPELLDASDVAQPEDVPDERVAQFVIRVPDPDGNGARIAYAAIRTVEEDDPEPPAPPCGNPLNETDDFNPLNYGTYNPGGGTMIINPLDEPGEGGFTPSCTPESQPNN